MTPPSQPEHALPPELVSDWEALSARWQDGPLSKWLVLLPEQLATGLSPARYGDLPRWRDALSALPTLPTADIQLTTARVGLSGTAPAETMEALHCALMELHPWRKGPFELCGLHVDTEWRSDWKWDRLEDAIAPLDGRRVLDVGCGTGYSGRPLEKAGHTWVGTDISQRRLEAARAPTRAGSAGAARPCLSSQPQCSTSRHSPPSPSTSTSCGC